MKKIAFLLCSLFLPSVPALSQQPPTLFSEVVDRADLSPVQERRLALLTPQVKEGTLRIVRANADAPFADSLRLGVEGSEVVLRTQSMERRSEREFSWSGADRPPQAEDALAGTRAVLVSQDGEMFGTVHKGKTILELRPLGSGLHVLFERDFAKLPPEHPNGTEGGHPSFKKPTPPPTPHQADAAPSRRVDVSPATAVPCSPIDVLVVYTVAVAKRVGTPSLLVSLAEKETNTSYANSGIRSRIRVVHSYQTTYKETGNVETDLAAFRNKGDGVMDEVHALRDLYAADVAVLLVDSADFCGLAADIYAEAANAFALVKAECATGYYSFGHEIGHLQGARHNPEMDPTNEPYPYCHGYLDAAHKVRTVMAYNCVGGDCVRVDYWAGPSIKYEGRPMGAAGLHEDARLLDETSCRVAGFRSAQHAPPSLLVVPPPPATQAPGGGAER